MGTKTQKLSNVVDQIVEWQAVVTADGSTGLTTVAGRGYFIDTTSGAITVTLPASPVFGDTITITDYASTFATNNVTLNPNGNKIEGATTNALLSTNDQTHTLVYTDTTQGWKIVNQDTASSIQPTYTAATGGTVTTSGDYKIHSFTGDADFVVSAVGNPTGGGASADYLVVAGGGGSDMSYGGGGAGGFRYSAATYCSPSCAPGHPLRSPVGLTISTTTYPITVGAGGVGATNPNPAPGTSTAGSNSIFSTITSAGGGRGANYTRNCTTLNGGSGGGGGSWPGPGPSTGGTGNTPPVSPSQGNNGGSGLHIGCDVGGGGGGAIAVGSNAAPPYQGGNGGAGAGLPTAFGCNGVPCGAYRYYSGGGGGGPQPGGALAPGLGGLGGGGNSKSPARASTAGTANTGGGAGASNPTPNFGQAGGSGIVVVRYKFQ
jgi:hypothetical protein